MRPASRRKCPCPRSPDTTDPLPRDPSGPNAFPTLPCSASLDCPEYNRSSEPLQFPASFLGERLFLDMQFAQGREEFGNGLRRLYQTSLNLREADNEAGIQQVQEAFEGQNNVIAVHWTGQPPASSAARTGGPAVTRIPTAVTIPVRPREHPTPAPPKRTAGESENRSATQTPTPAATKTPTGPAVTNRFLELRYDASKTINNRQLPPTGHNCWGGSGQLTRWSKTLNVEGQKAYIQDARGNALQVKELHFAQVHPGRSYADTECPRDQFVARADVINLNNEVPPDLTGYVAEWQDENGNLIGSRLAHDGVAITLEHDDEPEDLYGRPARLLIYDQKTPGARPAPTPVSVIRPEEKELVIEINPSLWEGNGNNRISPNLTEEGHEIRDSKGKLWRIVSIRTFDRTSRIGSTDYTSTEITVELRNVSRARADFTGFNIQTRELDGAPAGAGYWMPPAGQQPIGEAQITSGLSENFLRAVTIRIWDSYEPSLKSPTGRIPTPRPTSTPIPTPKPTSTPTPTPRPTSTLIPTPILPPVLELFDNSARKEYTVLFPTGWTVQPGLELTTFTSPDGRQVMEIGHHLVQHDASLGGFADEYLQEVLKEAPGWDHFTEKSARGQFLPAGNAVITTFDRRKTAADCTEDGITHLLRSKFFPKRSMGYSLTVTLCQEDLQKWQEIRGRMMASFTEKFTEE